MTISNTPRKAGPYAGNGSATTFAFSFKVFSAADVLVIRAVTATGAETTLALTTDYTVSLNADQDTSPGGTITTTTAPATGQTITLSSDMDYTQPVELTNNGGFYPRVINDALDRSAIQVQQLDERMGRTLTLPLSVPSAVDSDLPLPVPNSVIGWNSAGTSLQNVSPSTLATIVSSGTSNADVFSGDGVATTFSLSANPGALSNLDVSINGVVQYPNADYLWSSGTALTFTSAPPAGSGNILVRYIQALPQGSADWNALTNKPILSIKDFGAVCDGVTNDSASVVAMQSALGYVRIPPGTSLIGSNITVNVPIYFDAMAKLSIGSGVTLTISEAFINSPRQHIFDGTGAVAMTGERTVSVMAEWFGVVPGNSTGDLAAAMNRLFAACPSGRECFISVGAGSFYFKTAPNAIPRAVRIVGAGERITNFVFRDSLSVSGDFFTTGGEGVWLEGVQFTCTDGLTQRTSGALIKLAHQYCKVRNIWFTDSFGGVDVSANYCEVDGVVAFRNSSAAGSYMVKLSNGGVGARVRNVQYNDSTVGLGPENAIRIEAHTNFVVDSITTAGAVTAVGIVPSSGSCSGGMLDNIIARGATGVNGVVIQSTGTGAVDKLHFGKVIADGLTGIGFKMQKDGSGIMKYIEIGSLESRACSGGGFVVNATSGRPDHWHLKGGYCRSSAGNGYDIANSYYWTITGCESVSNTGTGSLIAATCANFIYTNNRNLFNTAAQLTDNSGAVTKVVTNNI